MAALTAAGSIEPSFGIGDRMEKSRKWCGIKSAGDMADRLNTRLANRIDKPIKPSTVSAWEAGTNQPTMIRMEDLIPVWVDICNEAGEPHGRGTSIAFIYGIETSGDRSANRKILMPYLSALPDVTGQTDIFEQLDSLDRHPFLTPV